MYRGLWYRIVGKLENAIQYDNLRKLDVVKTLNRLRMSQEHSKGEWAMPATKGETEEQVDLDMAGIAATKFDLIGDDELALVVWKHFSPVPGQSYGRGDTFVGKELRSMISSAFHEACRLNRKLLIDLDNTTGYTVTFLVATFNRLSQSLAEQEGITEQKVNERIEVVTKNTGTLRTVEIVRDYDRRKAELLL